MPNEQHTTDAFEATIRFVLNVEDPLVSFRDINAANFERGSFHKPEWPGQSAAELATLVKGEPGISRVRVGDDAATDGYPRQDRCAL